MSIEYCFNCSPIAAVIKSGVIKKYSSAGRSRVADASTSFCHTPKYKLCCCCCCCCYCVGGGQCLSALFTPSP